MSADLLANATHIRQNQCKNHSKKVISIEVPGLRISPNVSGTLSK
jgi:hypothetical protein